MALEFPLPQARHHLDELVARAHQDHERIVLTEHGKPTAVLISVAELDELQYAQDLADIALCEAIKAKNEVGLPHEEFMAVLDAEVPARPTDDLLGYLAAPGDDRLSAVARDRS